MDNHQQARPPLGLRRTVERGALEMRPPTALPRPALHLRQELAHELDRRGHLIATTPRGLYAALEALPVRAASLEPWPEGDATEFARYLGAALGVGAG